MEALNGEGAYDGGAVEWCQHDQENSDFAADLFESFRELCFVGGLHGVKLQRLGPVSTTAFARTAQRTAG